MSKVAPETPCFDQHLPAVAAPQLSWTQSHSALEAFPFGLREDVAITGDPHIQRPSPRFFHSAHRTTDTQVFLVDWGSRLGVIPSQVDIGR